MLRGTLHPPSMIASETPWISIALRRAAALGLAFGLGEAVIRLGYRYLAGRMRINTGLDVIWMAPLADAIVFLVITLSMVALLVMVGRRLSLVTRLALVTGALIALGVWSLTERVPQIGRRSGAILGLGAGVAAAGALRRRQRTHTRMERTLFPLGAALAAAAATLIVSGKVRERRAIANLPAHDGDAPNVLMLILDTVRAQSMSMNGYARRTTPVLDTLARSGVLFEQAYATAPWTLPSHASMFTGRYAHELTADWATPLDDADATLAERFSAAGYATGAFMANYVVSWETGLDRGFAHYDDYQRDFRQLALSAAVLTWLGHWPRLRRALNWYQHVNRQSADAINARTSRWILSHRARPYFAVVNYFDAHEFYLPPAPFATAFGPDTARKNAFISFTMAVGGFAFRTQKAHMLPHELQAELNAYEGAIAYLDSRIGALLDTLAAAGALDNTIIIVTADHGEHFGEHGKFEHGDTLYPQVLHVPLLIIAADRSPSGARVRAAVTLRDLAATIEQLALGTATLPGSSLQTLWDTDSTTRSTSAVLSSRTIADPTGIADPARRGAWAAVIGDHLVIEYAGATPETEVFDLAADSLATRNIAHDPAAEASVESARNLYGGLWWRSRELVETRPQLPNRAPRPSGGKRGVVARAR